MVALAIVLCAGGWGPSSSEPEVTPEQLEYSKKLYGEGEEAMKAENYDVALTKFREGYRYAPHLHMFTFNIASAADAGGDCRTAQSYFQMFVDLVPKHPQRKQAQKRLSELAESCKVEPETAQINAPPAEGAEDAPTGGAGRQTREEREAIRVLQEGLEEILSAEVRYRLAKARYSSEKAFARAARRKKRHAKKLRKAAAEIGIEPEGDLPEVKIPDDVKRACGEAESQEKRLIDAMEAVLEIYDSPKLYRAATKILKASERRDRLAFDACS